MESAWGGIGRPINADRPATRRDRSLPAGDLDEKSASEQNSPVDR
jgi:hypothetical protein